VDITGNVNLKKFISKRLFEILSDKIYYPYGKDIWILDLDERNWYFQYNSEGKLHYNPKVFDDFFYFFCLEQKQYQILLKKWFESSFGYQVNERYGFPYGVVKQFLDLKRHFTEENIKLEYFLHEIKVY